MLTTRRAPAAAPPKHLTEHLQLHVPTRSDSHSDTGAHPINAHMPLAPGTRGGSEDAPLAELIPRVNGRRRLH